MREHIANLIANSLKEFGCVRHRRLASSRKLDDLVDQLTFVQTPSSEALVGPSLTLEKRPIFDANSSRDMTRQASLREEEEEEEKTAQVDF